VLVGRIMYYIQIPFVINFRLNIVNSSRIAVLKYHSKTYPLAHSLASFHRTIVTVASLVATEVLCGRHLSRRWA
jgi:hypothetical protein